MLKKIPLVVTLAYLIFSANVHASEHDIDNQALVQDVKEKHEEVSIFSKIQHWISDIISAANPIKNPTPGHDLVKNPITDKESVKAMPDITKDHAEELILPVDTDKIIKEVKSAEPIESQPENDEERDNSDLNTINEPSHAGDISIDSTIAMDDAEMAVDYIDENGSTATIKHEESFIKTNLTMAGDTHIVEQESIKIEISPRTPYLDPQANDDFYIIDEDTDIIIEPLLNDVFYKENPFKIISVGEVKNSSILMEGNNILFSPYRDFVGKVAFPYIMADKNNIFRTAIINVTINNVNDAPIANNDSFTVYEDTPLLLPDLTKNDSDVDFNNNISVVAIQQPANGTIESNNGVHIYTPNLDFHGIDTTQYTLSDNNGGADTGLISILVLTKNDNPVAIDDEYSMSEDGVLKISNFLANDYDKDEDIIYMSEYTLPGNGSVSFNGKIITYTPNKNFNGKDSFEYTLMDTKAGSSKATIFVMVNPENDAPTAHDDGLYTGLQGQPIYIETLLDNDTDTDGDDLTISKFTRPLNGELSFNGSDSFTYIPNPDFSGLDMFAYLVSDGNHSSDLAAVEIYVKPNSNLASSIPKMVANAIDKSNVDAMSQSEIVTDKENIDFIINTINDFN